MSPKWRYGWAPNIPHVDVSPHNILKNVAKRPGERTAQIFNEKDQKKSAWETVTKYPGFFSKKSRKMVGLFLEKKLQKTWTFFRKKSKKTDEKRHPLKPFGTVTVPNGLRSALFSSVFPDFFLEIFQLFFSFFLKKSSTFFQLFSEKKSNFFPTFSIILAKLCNF